MSARRVAIEGAHLKSIHLGVHEMRVHTIPNICKGLFKGRILGCVTTPSGVSIGYEIELELSSYAR